MSREAVGHSDKKRGAASKPVEGGTVDDAAFRGYINVPLNDAEKAAWASWSVTAEVWDALDAQVGMGVNLSVKRERKQGGFLASATQRDPASVNAGLVVTARGGSAGVALTRVLFILGVLGREERWEATQPLASPDRW